MTARDKKISKALLEILHERDGKTMAEEFLLAEVIVRTECALSEARSILKNCDTRGWLNGAASEFAAGGKIWATNDEGEIARMKL